MDYLVSVGYSQRRATRVVGLSRSAYCRLRAARQALGNDPGADKYAHVRAWMNQFADTHRRWGYKRAWHRCREEGLRIGRDTFRHLWRQEGLRIGARKRSKRRVGQPQVRRTHNATMPGQVWAMDFQFDSDWQGKAFKVCNVIDEFTREHLGFRVDRSLAAKDVLEMLDVLVCERGAPKILRMDNGPEFISHALAGWASEHDTVQAFAPPGQPWHNGFVESLHNRMRDELFEDNLFDDLEHARSMIQWWSQRYNHEHPHSALGYRSPAAFAQHWATQHQ